MKRLLHPVFFPNIAHFAAMLSGAFQLEREDNYQKQTYRNRTYIYSANGMQMLSVPIKHTVHPEGHRKYKDVILEDNFNWKKQHWKTIQTAYRTSPFFEFYEDDLAPFFEKKHHRLYDMNLESIELIAESIQAELDYTFTESYESKPKSAIDLRPLVNAKNPTGLLFDPYTQVFDDRHGFIPNLSILDLIFNEGPNTLNYLEGQKP